MDISVCIVSYNTKDLTLACIDSVLKSEPAPHELEIIVVDNGSKDGSPEAILKSFPEVRLLKNAENLYLSTALNQALGIARGSYLYLLNSDVLVWSGSIKKMVDFLELNQAAAAVSCKMSFADGKIQRIGTRDCGLGQLFLSYTFLGKLFPGAKKAFHEKYLYGDWDRLSVKEVETVPDSNLMVRKSYMEVINGYDEQFKLYFTENDLCMRFRAAGWKIFYIPDGRIVHPERQSVKNAGIEIIARVYEQDTLRYCRKHFGLFWALALKSLIGCTNLMMRLFTPDRKNIFHTFLMPAKNG